MTWEFFSPLLIVLFALLFIWLERKFPFTPGQSLFREGFWNDLALYSLLQSYLLSLVIFGFIHWLDRFSGASHAGIISGWPIWVQVLFSLITHDFYIYWFHRAQHNVGWLWRLHEAHHSTHDVDWLSGSRSHSLEILINQTVEFLPLVLLGCHPDTILIKATIDAIWGMYIHSNINVRTGILQYVINGPEMHRWHHAIDSEAYNQNYSTKFAVWDWLFGTAWFPSGRKPSGYGLTDVDFPTNYLRQHSFAFRKKQPKA